MDAVDRLAELLSGRRTFALIGAGCSTESGIPDYRGPETLARSRNPIQYRAFLDDPGARRRYWSRSFVGWPRIASAVPNPAHHALAELEQSGAIGGLVTQNVDGLHHKAGSRRIVELHGALRWVVCLGCGAEDDRDAVQARMADCNPSFASTGPAAPDGDADVDAEGFVVPTCAACGGVLKPAVVFFGENVPRPRVDAAYDLLDDAGAVLVVGSSLTVFSGYRFVKRAAERGLPVAIVNLGPTRGDPLAALRVDDRAGAVLPALRDRLR
jgi:NAD-dependent SIR2 family protein deacetylase